MSYMQRLLLLGFFGPIIIRARNKWLLKIGGVTGGGGASILK